MANALRDVLKPARLAFEKLDPEFDRLRHLPRSGYVWINPAPLYVALDDNLEYCETLDVYRFKGRELSLRASGKALLACLTRTAPKFVPSAELRDRLDEAEGVADSEKTPSLLRVQMLHLRRAFLSLDPAFDQLENRRKEGYRWRPTR